MDNKEKQTYLLDFKGYWREQNKLGVPATSGIYLVYRCVYNPQQQTVGLHEIIYIGKAENGRDRIANHERIDDFNAQLQQGEELCYAFAEVPKENLDIVENALIFAQKPKLNDQLKDKFNYSPVAIKADGRCACLTYTDYSIS